MPQHFLTIPYPPSVNSYWGFHGHRRYLTPEAVNFKRLVLEEVILTRCPNFGKDRLEITITLYPKDKRIRDIDNSIKSCLDALCEAIVFDDDSQIDVLLVQRGENFKGGKASVTIKSLLYKTDV